MTKPATKKYVCVIRIAVVGGGKKNHRSLPMPLEAAMAEVATYTHDGVEAWSEEANKKDLAPDETKKRRAKERRERKKEIETRRLVP